MPVLPNPAHALRLSAVALCLVALGVWTPAQILPGEVVAQSEIDAANGGLTLPILASDGFGSSAAALGDVDGDGIVDLAIGADRDGSGEVVAGAVRVLLMDADGTVRDEIEITEGSGGFGGDLGFGDEFGVAVAGIGDLDGDGVPDLAVGADRDDGGGLLVDTGAVWILFLAPDGTVRDEVRIAAGGAGGFTGPLLSQDRFGSALAALGDVDGDGVGDLAVGAPGDAGSSFLEGAVYVLFLRCDGTVAGHQEISTVAGGFGGDVADKDLFGIALAPLGDLDGNGVPDVAAGASQDDDGDVGNNNQGAVWILFLAADGTVVSEQKISETQGGFTGVLDGADLFGLDVAALPDLDGDGHPELAVAAPRDDDGAEDAGAVYVLMLAADGTVKSHRKLADGSGGFVGTLDALDAFGSGLAWQERREGAGVGTLVVCASGDDDGGTNLGGLWLLELTDGQWLDVGGGLPGPAGVPVLTGTGNTTAGARVALALADGAPSAPVSLVVGGSAANQALLGGVLVPSPDVVVPLGSTDAGGALDVALRWPSGVPTNTTLWIQAWLPDAAAPLGWAASGALVTTTP